MSDVEQMLDHLSPEHQAMVAALWGKSGERHGGFALLLGHLLDSAAVGELIWDQYMSPALRAKIDACSRDGASGRGLLAFLCGIHDIGKATPAFQRKVPDLWAAVERSGLRSGALTASAANTLHADAGGRIVHELLRQVPEWDAETIAWVWPMVAGHHGLIRPAREVTSRRRGVRDEALGWATDTFGQRGWRAVQEHVLHLVVQSLGFRGVGDVAPRGVPALGVQLVIAGLVIMADWIASSDACRNKAVRLSDLTMEASRRRARGAWDHFKLRGGWDLSGPRPDDLMAARFDRKARPVQLAVCDAVVQMPAPGIVIVEAPMGEGKTEAALVAAELLSHKFGLDGLFVGMPTQATSDPMFARVMKWSGPLGDRLPVALTHGKARFNAEWRGMIGESWGGFEICDEQEGESEQVVRWFLGRDRPVLTPLCVGTIDNLLHAATRTKRVSLRFAGLGGKVVILDEIHSYSVYTQQFLSEALRWLGSSGNPVVLLTATLPPELKDQLLAAYLEGATGQQHGQPLSTEQGNPLVTWACAPTRGGIASADLPCASALRERQVSVEVLEDAEGDSDHCGAQMDLTERLAPVVNEGGRVLVVCNTVRRAQDAYVSLRESFGDAVHLLHARFTAADRAKLAEAALLRLGPEASAVRGAYVLVGTQVLEQSLDLDADLIVTDLAPIDLLLQRVGRVHRHAARDRHRPPSVETPRVLVTGLRWSPTSIPLVPRGVDDIYDHALLIRSAALVREALSSGGWVLPTDIRPLVTRGYSDDDSLVPDAWRADYANVRQQSIDGKEKRKYNARDFLLGTTNSMGKKSLEGLHAYSAENLPTDDAVSAVVRDGPETIEVVMVRRRGDDLYTLSGRRLVTGCVPVDDDDAAIQDACGSSVRLPPHPRLTAAARGLRPPAVFESDPDLGGLRVVELGEDGSAELGGETLRYDAELGLQSEYSRRSAR